MQTCLKAFQLNIRITYPTRSQNTSLTLSWQVRCGDQHARQGEWRAGAATEPSTFGPGQHNTEACNAVLTELGMANLPAGEGGVRQPLQQGQQGGEGEVEQGEAGDRPRGEVEYLHALQGK